MNMNFNFNNPTNLIFGRGSLNELGSQTMPGKKALLLISNGKSTRENGYLDRTLEQLKKAGVETALFDKIMENPIKDVIMEGGLRLQGKTSVILSLRLAAGLLLTLRRRLRQWQSMRATFGIMCSAAPANASRLKRKGFPLLRLRLLPARVLK